MKAPGMMAGATALAMVIAVAAERDARACSFELLEDHVLDPAEQQVDSEAPVAPVIQVVDFSRNPANNSACGAHNSCEGTGQIIIELDPGQDDRTGPEELGYRVEVVSGTLPEGMVLPAKPVRVGLSGSLFFLFNDDAQDVEVTLQVTAVDLAGNESDPVIVEAVDGSGGCRAAGRSAGMWLLPVLALLLLAARMRPGRDRDSDVAISG